MVSKATKLIHLARCEFWAWSCWLCDWKYTNRFLSAYGCGGAKCFYERGVRIADKHNLW